MLFSNTEVFVLKAKQFDLRRTDKVSLPHCTRQLS